MFENVEQAIDWIIKRRKTEHLHSDFHNYLKRMDNPQNKLKCLHVGGTNGKGSTVNYLRSILQTAGYKVGSFTSPHLKTHLDRIRINDENISAEYFLKKVNENYDLWQQLDLTMFEIDMLISIDYFLDNDVDYVIYEVGLGGRLDATNIINPLAAVITNIDLEHTQILGDTIEKIAYEKAGIIKEKSIVITAEKKKAALDVFQKICADKQAKLITVQDISEQVEDKGINFVYDGEEYFISARAHYQVNNAVLAIETVKKLNKENLLNVKKEAIRKGLLTDLPGRFEIISENPKIIIDGAHNVHGIDALLSSLKEDEEYIFVFSALSDKNYKVMLEKLLVWGEVIVTEFESNRKVKALDLALGQDVLICFDYLQAIKYALTKNKILIVTGSLYFISLVRNSFVK
ncbi:MAG: folylpolyglutamate synthase/dihydrofolate synthase family protein [Bacillota bacterium]|jgi:dihydrofolate synthase/folylpolyglutamate synthase|nr:folylpolyglutamate synthase/dihydrofolate synthase family protein [Bacillota bacterium]NLL26516.1 bifunctional folylpolyglutamate synthase/dihydrofolate synthase [Erysipelotrichia bacterium]